MHKQHNKKLVVEIVNLFLCRDDLRAKKDPYQPIFLPSAVSTLESSVQNTKAAGLREILRRTAFILLK